MAMRLLLLLQSGPWSRPRKTGRINNPARDSVPEPSVIHSNMEFTLSQKSRLTKRKLLSPQINGAAKRPKIGAGNEPRALEPNRDSAKKLNISGYDNYPRNPGNLK